MKGHLNHLPRRILASLMCLAIITVLLPVPAVKAAVLAGNANSGTPAPRAACTNHSYTSVTYGTTCQTYAHTRYTCIYCGDSYNVYPDEAMSDWQTEKPNVDDSIIESATQYRYCTYETTTSYDPEMEGCEQVGSQWVLYDENVVHYVNAWPAGFDKTNTLYNRYSNLAQKVSNTSTAMTKVEAKSDQVVGYLYYHWCYSGYAYTSDVKTGSYNRFHAYYSTTAPSSANASDPADSSYRFDSSTACSDSKWYFAVPVYAQTYTTYRNLFTYRCWGEPSQWSLTPIEAAEGRQVETRTVYRYVTGALSPHNYVNNVCTVCGESKAAADYYLFGWINGSDYGCENDYQNMGIYKFVGGKLTATFTQDSYVAVKTEGNTDWYMTNGWQGQATSVTLYNTNDLADANKLYVPGGAKLEFTLTDNGNGTLTLSYVLLNCTHNYKGEVTAAPSCLNSGQMTYTCTICGHSYIQNLSATGHSLVPVLTKPTCDEGGYTTYTCSSCSYSYIGDRTAAAGHSYSSTIVPNTCTEQGYTLYSCGVCGYSYKADYTQPGHFYVNGSCEYCGAADPDYDPDDDVIAYYLVGYINGADHGSEGDWENLGNYPFVGGKLTATFTQDSYVFVKSADNSRWLLAERYCEDTTCTLSVGKSEKLFVPGGVELTFTLTENGTNSVTLSYVKSATGCAHSYTSKVTTAATCTATGINTFTCSLCGFTYTQTVAALGHNYVDGTCSRCGISDPNGSQPAAQTYYLIGWINGADHGCEGDWENLGNYPFVNGKLTATFNQDSYVFVKTGDNSKWLLAESYCEDTVCTFSEGKSEKMFVPGGVELTFTLTQNADGSVTVRYTTATASVIPTLTLKAPTLEFKDMITVNAFYTAENIQDVAEMGMITYSTKVSTVSVDTAEYIIPGATYDAGSGRYFSASQGIHAKFLGDKVYLAIYAKLNDGTYAYSKLASYSAVQYATNQLKNSTDVKLKQLVAAMLNYGAEAQLYFGHNTTALANSTMTAEQKTLPAGYSSGMVGSVPAASTAKQGSFANNQGFASRKPAISFEGAFCINYFFTPRYAPTNGITLYYWNAADFESVSVLTTANATGSMKMEGSGTGEYRGDIGGISAKDLSQAVYVAAVYQNGGTTWTSGVLGYSIGAYCSSQASKGGDIADLAKATAVYGYHAKAYFG